MKSTNTSHVQVRVHSLQGIQLIVDARANTNASRIQTSATKNIDRVAHFLQQGSVHCLRHVLRRTTGWRVRIKKEHVDAAALSDAGVTRSAAREAAVVSGMAVAVSIAAFLGDCLIAELHTSKRNCLCWRKPMQLLDELEEVNRSGCSVGQSCSSQHVGRGKARCGLDFATISSSLEPVKINTVHNQLDFF